LRISHLSFGKTIWKILPKMRHSREWHCKEGPALAFILFPSAFILFSPAPFPGTLSKNRRVSAAHLPHYHVLVGLQHLFFYLNSPQTTPNTQNWNGKIFRQPFFGVFGILRFSLLRAAHFSGEFYHGFR
jgi:hypothetical protein